MAGMTGVSVSGEPPAHGADEGAAGPDEQALDPRVIPLRRIVLGLTALVLATGLLLILTIVLVAADDLPAWLRTALTAAWTAFVVLSFWHAYRWPAIAYRHTAYRVDDDGIEIRRGVIWRAVTRVPRSRVQHTDVSQGPIERRYGLGTLVVYTAGTDHARVALPGLRHQTALRLRDGLRPDGPADAV